MQSANSCCVRENILQPCSILMKMTDLLECWDSMLGSHCRRTAVYVEMLAGKLQELGLYKEIMTAEYLDGLKKGAGMHEIGTLPFDNKKAGKNRRMQAGSGSIKQDAETAKALMNSHLDYIDDKNLAGIIWEMTVFQHAKWDGTGWPQIKGEEIPLSARILATADLFDMRMEMQPGGDGRSIGDALEAVKKERGKTLDPQVADVFLALLKENVELLF